MKAVPEPRPASDGVLGRELRRKLFHLLNLAYLAAYHRLGPGRVLWALGAWILLEGALEVARLQLPSFNGLLLSAFGGIHRESEASRVSGIFWTASGCWLTFWRFGASPVVVDAALLYLALGDTAAALVGLSVGRHFIGVFGRRKTAEGSLACLLVCAAAGAAAGLRGAAVAAGAAAAAALELLPLPVDDNLWLPFGSAAVLSLFRP